MSESADELWQDPNRRFEVRSVLGRGGMGIVYEAFDREREVTVALKMLPHVDAASLYRFKQEFRLLAGISHPNLASLYELHADGDRWFFTMELVDGTDLLSYLRGRSVGGAPGSSLDDSSDEAPTTDMSGRAPEPPAPSPVHPDLPTTPAHLNEPRLRAALLQLTSALITLHAHRRLHCDIKPRNVLVTRDGRVVVLDFGLATEFGGARPSPALSDTVYGTAGYMAPEQVTGRGLTPACDWYAVGSLLYEALTGRRPFLGSPHEVLAAKQTQKPPEPVVLHPGVPDDLNTICMRLLAASPRTRAGGDDLLALLGAPQMVAAPPPQDDGGLLVGREAELLRLRDAFDTMVKGRPTCVFVHAPSGAGKSALLAHAASLFEAEGNAVVVSGRCYEQESVHYKALDSLMDGLSRHLASLPTRELRASLPKDVNLLATMFPVLERVPVILEAWRHRTDTTSRQELRDRAAGALRRLLRVLAARRPLVLLIDDLQWGDADSAALLLGLLRPPDPPPFLLLCAFRREHAQASVCVQTLLEAPADAHERVEVALEPLSPSDAKRLAARLLGDDAALGPSLARRIARESGGNPYFVHALVAHVREEAPLATDDVLSEGLSLDDVMRRRTSRLPPGMRRLLEVVALAGRPIREADAYAAADLDTRDPGYVAVLRNARLIRGGGDQTIETYHDRVRESVVQRIPTASLPRLHRRLAVTLEARGDVDPEWVAAHYRGAGEPFVAAVHYSEAADMAATALAFDRAAELYLRSIELGAADPAVAQSLRLKLADALANAGRSIQAATVYQEAARDAQGAVAVGLERTAAYQFCIGGAMRQGRAVLEADLAGIGVRVPRTARAAITSLLANRLRMRWMEWTGRLRPAASAAEPSPDTLERLDLLWAGAAALYDIDLPVGAALQSRHLVEAIRAREPGRIAAALALQASFEAQEKGSRAGARTQALLAKAREFAARVATPYARAMTRFAESNVAWWTTHDWDLAFAALDDAEDLLRRCTGVTWELSLVHNHRVSLLRTRGHYAEMIRVGSSILAEARQRGDVYIQARVGILVGPDTLILQGRPASARAAVRHIRARWLRREFPNQRILSAFADIEIDIYCRRHASAFRRVERYWRALERAQFLRIELVRIVAYALKAGQALASIEEHPEDTARLLRVAEQATARLEREGPGRAQATARGLRAAIAVHQGRLDDAAVLLSSALAWYSSVGFDAYAAATRYYLGLVPGAKAGESSTADAHAWFAAQGTHDPARVAAVHLMGFPRSLDEHLWRPLEGEMAHASSDTPAG
jgi:serine/threonine protein kinase